MGGTRGSSRRRRTIQTKIEAIVTKHVDHRGGRIGGRANHHGLSDGDIIKKKALNMVLATSLRSNQFLHLNVFFLPYKKCSCVIFDPAMELNFGIIISFFFLGDRTASQLKTSSLVVEIG